MKRILDRHDPDAPLQSNVSQRGGDDIVALGNDDGIGVVEITECVRLIDRRHRGPVERLNRVQVSRDVQVEVGWQGSQLHHQAVNADRPQRDSTMGQGAKILVVHLGQPVSSSRWFSIHQHQQNAVVKGAADQAAHIKPEPCLVAKQHRPSGHLMLPYASRGGHRRSETEHDQSQCLVIRDRRFRGERTNAGEIGPLRHQLHPTNIRGQWRTVDSLAVHGENPSNKRSPVGTTRLIRQRVILLEPPIVGRTRQPRGKRRRGGLELAKA